MSDDNNPSQVSGPVVGRGEFVFAAAHLDHGHIYGQCEGLVEAGGLLKWVYDPDPKKVESLLGKHPGAKSARSLDEILEDPEVQMVAAAAIPCDRAAIGCRVMKSGKDYFTGKAPFISLEQLADAKRTVAETGRKYMVYYSERIHSECSVHAEALVRAGAIGRVIQVLGLGPHRLGVSDRPDWFFDHARYGGIICDIGSQQTDQYLAFSGADDAVVTQAASDNLNHSAHPDFEDYGEATLLGANGVRGYFRVDWFTPDGLRTWGDGRTLILGTSGYIELRKFIDIGHDPQQSDTLILVDGKGETRMDLSGKVGFPFFGQLILDSLNRTENAMTQHHAFKAGELALRSQQFALTNK